MITFLNKALEFIATKIHLIVAFTVGTLGTEVTSPDALESAKKGLYPACSRRARAASGEL